MTLVGGVNGGRFDQKPVIIGASHPTQQRLKQVGAYTVGHLQGGLQLADLLIRKISGESYQHSTTIVNDYLSEAEARLPARLQQKSASLSSRNNIAADPYWNHRAADTLSTPNGHLLKSSET